MTVAGPDATTREARNERFKDLALAAALAVVGIGGFVFVGPSDMVYPGPGGLTWRSLPFIYSGLLLALVALYVGSTVLDLLAMRRGRVPPALLGPRPPVQRDSVADMRRLATFGCILAYALALAPFGFAIATPVLLFAMLRVLGRRDLMRNAVVALVGGLLLWLLFVGILKLPLEGRTFDPLTPALNALYRATGAR